LVEAPSKYLSNKAFKKRYGVVLEDLKMKHYSRYYYPFFLFRRLLYAFCL